MSPALIDRLGGSAISFVVALFLLWKIWNALLTGTVTVSFGNTMNSFLNLNADRSKFPTYFWILVGFLAISALFVSACFVFIATGHVH